MCIDHTTRYVISRDHSSCGVTFSSDNPPLRDNTCAQLSMLPGECSTHTKLLAQDPGRLQKQKTGFLS